MFMLYVLFVKHWKTAMAAFVTMDTLETEKYALILTSVQPTVTHVMSMPFVTTQVDLTNAAAILGSSEMDKPALILTNA